MTAIHCRRCGRTLTAAACISTGYGRTCARRTRAALDEIADMFTVGQVRSATELITDGGLVARPGGSWQAVSSDGATVYAVDPAMHTCTCTAGRNGRRCYHLCAALAAAA